MDVLDLEECDFIQYRPDPYEFIVVNMKRDRQWFAEKLPIMKDLWDRVIHGRAHGLSEFREDNRIYDKDGVQSLQTEDCIDAPVQGVSE